MLKRMKIMIIVFTFLMGTSALANLESCDLFKKYSSFIKITSHKFAKESNWDTDVIHFGIDIEKLQKGEIDAKTFWEYTAKKKCRDISLLEATGGLELTNEDIKVTGNRVFFKMESAIFDEIRRFFNVKDFIEIKIPSKSNIHTLFKGEDETLAVKIIDKAVISGLINTKLIEAEVVLVDGSKIPIKL